MRTKMKKYFFRLLPISLLLCCSGLMAEQHYHALDVRVVNKSGFDMGLYMNVSGHEQEPYAPSAICIKSQDVKDGSEYAHRCNIRSTSSTVEKLSFHGIANCYRKEGGFQGAAYAFPDRSNGQRYYTIGPRGNAPINSKGEYVFVFKASMFPCRLHVPKGYKRAPKIRLDS